MSNRQSLSLPPFLIFDGAMGTSLQSRTVPKSAWMGQEGCNEVLNLTAPDLIRDIHASFLAAGCDVLETNTFGASPLTLSEYGLSDQADAINRSAVRIAREALAAAAPSDRPRFVFGSVGPGTRLPSLGQVDYDTLANALQIQIGALIGAGVDGILLETCQDPLQIKAGLDAFEICVRAFDGPRPALAVSVTIEPAGTLLIGSSIQTVMAILSPYSIDLLGLNCATGPDAMRIHLDALAEAWPGRILCMPNAGMPILEGTSVHYPMDPETFATRLTNLARDVPLQAVGGCCGTTPDHIRALREKLDGYIPRARPPVHLPEQAASLFSSVDLTQIPPPLFIGERANATGSKAFREALLREDLDGAFHILSEQEETAAHLLDLSCAYAGRDEIRDLTSLVERAAREIRTPLVIDTTQVDALEAALKRIGGRAVINSINFEDGEGRADRVARLARRFGAIVIGLTIDEQGMAMTAERKVAVARRLVAFCVDRGLKPGDVLIDPLTFTICSGDETLRTAAMETLEALRAIHRELPGVRTLLGLSNISFGLKPPARRALNAVFLDRARLAGLDACIINTAVLTPLDQLSPVERDAAEALLENRRDAGDPLMRYIELFEKAAPPEDSARVAALPPDEALAKAILRGQLQPLEETIPQLLPSRTAETILNEILIPAMKEVGRLFNDGRLQLPFVLKSAEVMKRAVDKLRPHFRHSDSHGPSKLLVIATVAGDVHDIGKNLVDIILSNNGFRVMNLGTKVSVEKMIETAREHRADAIGMSGLLVKSALLMTENIRAIKTAGLQIPVLLGGAALTPEFVAKSCVPESDGPVLYCRDAFAGLAAMQELAETGCLKSTVAPPSAPLRPATEPVLTAPPDLSALPPTPPFFGPRTTTAIPLDSIYPLLNITALVRGRWGYRRGNLTSAEFDDILNKEAYPELERLKRECADRDLFQPAAAMGWYPCRADGERLWVEVNGAEVPMDFPRQTSAPQRSIPDFFRRDRDVVGFFVVTLGPRIMEECERLRQADRYRDYLLLHGLAVETTDALAEWIHAKMRADLGFPDPEMALQDYIVQRYRGSRYGFGYPSCPDLSLNRLCCKWVRAESIGVTLSETHMMIPEVSTSALVAHHPDAKYFNV